MALAAGRCPTPSARRRATGDELGRGRQWAIDMRGSRRGGRFCVSKEPCDDGGRVRGDIYWDLTRNE